MNPNSMPGLDEFMKNPEMMKNAMDMMQNNPELIKKYMNMSNNDSSKNIDSLEETQYDFDTKVIISGLSNDTYNGKSGNIQNYNKESDRYEIFISDLNKTIAIKEKSFNIESLTSDSDSEDAVNEENQYTTNEANQDTTE